ncbi:MAG: c-type cytochrome [Sphingobacteriales bacterium]|nr:MAG: c-type cytochrome [Sphingobacteriales bacterium]
MKKTFIISGLSLLLAACGGNTDINTNDNDTTTIAVNTIVADTPETGTATPAPKPAVVQTDTTVTEKTVVVKVEEKVVAKPAAAAATGSVKGGQLLKASDCLACHKEDTKLVGPAYKDVAKKYAPTEANINMLAGKVISGGAGNWGQIPMSPHAGLSKSDAKEMVKYILAIK